MYDLPPVPELPVGHLSGSFNDKSTSYKYFWLLAILENVKEGKYTISMKDLAIRMLANVWFPVHYFRLSFGKQDQLSEITLALKKRLQIPESIRSPELYLILKEAYLINQLPEVNSLLNYVPYRFLSPWFTNDLKGQPDWKKNKLIERLSNTERSLYKIDSIRNCIFIDNDWLNYLHKNIAIIEGFTKWKLICYLQRNNTNVPNITEKLVFPSKRSMLDAYEFWIHFKNVNGSLQCIYTGQLLYEKSQISIDHYLPWSFVAHDQLWNLTPTSKEINSSKGNRIPNEIYFNSFTDLQFKAVQSALQHKPKLLEDHLQLLKMSLNELSSLSYEQFNTKMRKNFSPMSQLAKNMGFNEWIR